MINRFFFLFSSLVFLISNTASSIASDSLLTHTQHTPIELKPAFLNSEKSFQVASVCFLGIGCGDDGKFGKGDDYGLDTAQQCKNEGYIITSCTAPEVPYGQCPYNDGYFQECKNINGEKCQNEGYIQTCPEGNVLDDAQFCPYDISYKKCKCNPCEGYDYTYAEATSEGYILGASCNSCGTIKYQRQNAPCSGFLSCECGGEIGASSCKSGTNTLYSQCKECIKCNDDCPDGYYKTAGENGRCNFGSKTTTTECGTTCYQCKTPNSEGYYGCSPNCPEGYTRDEYNDYVCKPLICRAKIVAKYPEYFNGKNASCNYTPNSNYNFDRPFLGESAYVWYYNICAYSKEVITQSFYVEADFKKDFNECKNYCRPGYVFENKTLKGNLYIGSNTPSVSHADEGKQYHNNIIIDGMVTFADTVYVNNMTLTKNSQADLNAYRLENAILYPGSHLTGSINLTRGTIIENTADTPVTIDNLTLRGDIVSSHILAGTTGGIYLNLNKPSYIKNYSILRKPGGKINLYYSGASGKQGDEFDVVLFKNPGMDTVVNVEKNKDKYSGFRCVVLVNDISKKLCNSYEGNMVVTFLTDDAAKHVLPTCCSQDSDCPESSWNTGTVKCEGYSNK